MPEPAEHVTTDRGPVRIRQVQREQFVDVADAGATLDEVVAAGLAFAQSYPSKPLRIIVANPAGGPADGMARVFAQRLGGALGQSVVIDNRPGADGVIGSTAVARANPDGYTLYFTSSSHAVNPSLYRSSIPFRTLEDFEPIILIGNQALAMAVPASLPVKDLRELIALA